MDYEPSVILGRDQIRLISKFFRKMFKIRTIKFPVLRVLDLLETKFSNNLYYIVDEDENFASNVMEFLKQKIMSISVLEYVKASMMVLFSMMELH